MYLNRWMAVAAVAAMAMGVQAQSYLQGNPTYYKGNHEIIVPKSSIPHAGKPCTHYLIFVGPSASLPNGGVFHGPGIMLSGPAGYHPADIQAAYGMPSDGGSNAIALVDYGDEGNPLSDFNTFAAEFGLPQETSSDPTAPSNKVFQVVYAEGTKPPYDGGWSGEESLDMEWAHAMAPKAKIYLVESGGDLNAANQVAAQLTGVKEVSNSWGYPGEAGPGELGLDSDYVYPGVVFFASAGDIGGLQSYPAESPNVVGVGGTSLYMSGTTVTSEVAWSGTGGGPSLYEPRPTYQSVIQSIVGSARGAPDIAAVADPYTGVAVYNSSDGGWFVVGGTSVASPVCAGMTNTRGHFTTSSALELTRVYKNMGSKYYRDITSGSAGSFSAATGWDFCTGVGCPTGLYANQITSGIQPQSVSVMNGSLVSGSLSSLDDLDGNTYNVASTMVNNVGQTSTIVVTFNLGQPAGAVSQVLLGLNEKAPNGSTIQVFAYNWTSKSYEVVQAFPGVSIAQGDLATVNNVSRYVNGANVIQFAIRTFVPTRLGLATFTVATDQVSAQPVLSG